MLLKSGFKGIFCMYIYTRASTAVKYAREFTEYYTKINILLKSGFGFKAISPYSVNYKNRNKDLETST